MSEQQNINFYNHNITPEMQQQINYNDQSLKDDATIKDLQNTIGVQQDPKAIQNYYEQIKEPHPIGDKKVLNNGPSQVPQFELVDILTLGITYLIKLMMQGQKDAQQFKNDEPTIANNCKRNNIDYVENNEKDNVKDVSNGIGLYHDISELKKRISTEKNNQKLLNQLQNKQDKLSKLCKNNRTLDMLINSDKECCAVARGAFHVGVFASRINQNGEKEFFLIDQGGRKVPGSGFPNDEELSKNGINVMQVAATNGMCMATANACLQEISCSGLDNYLNTYAGLVQSSQRENVRYENIANANNINIDLCQQNAHVSNQKNKLQICFGNQTTTTQAPKNNLKLNITNVQNTSNDNYKHNVNAKPISKKMQIQI